MSNSYEPSQGQFAKRVAGHTMEVLHDDGLYRHLKFTNNGSQSYRFDLLTWPGHLTITGDMQTYTFARVRDMFEFFRGEGINPGYWSEKIQSPTETKEFSEELFKSAAYADLQGSCEKCRENFDEHMEYVDAEEHYQCDALNSFRCNNCGFQFEDFFEHEINEFTVHYIWCCRAIVWGIEQYDRLRRHPDPLLVEAYDRFVKYQMAADSEAPLDHVKFMNQLREAIGRDRS